MLIQYTYHCPISENEGEGGYPVSKKPVHNFISDCQQGIMFMLIFSV